MPEFLIRLLVGCLVIWLVDQVLVKFGIGEPPARIIQIITIILALIYIVVGWAVPIP